jgi:Bacterial Ig domain
VSVAGAYVRANRVDVYWDATKLMTCSASPCQGDVRNRSVTVQTIPPAPGPLAGFDALEVRLDGRTLGTCSAPTCRFRVRGNWLTVKAVAPTNASPSVSLNVPSPATGTVPVQIAATDPSGVTATELYVDGRLLAAFAGGSVTYAWDTTRVGNGTHAVLARAYSAAGSQAVSRKMIAVSNEATAPPTGTEPPPASAPTAVLVSPEPGWTIRGDVALVARIANASVQGVQFRVNGRALGAEVTTPESNGNYRRLWSGGTVPDGSYRIDAVARTAAGGLTTQGVTVAVMSTTAPSTPATNPPAPPPTPPATTAPPSAVLVSPEPGWTITVASDIALVARVANAGVQGVQFRVNGQALGAEVTTPEANGNYRRLWPARTVPNGSYRIDAVARTAAGALTTQSVTVAVQVPAPPPTTTASSPSNPATPPAGPAVSAPSDAIRLLLGPQLAGSSVYESDRMTAANEVLANFPTIAKYGEGSWYIYDVGAAFYKLYYLTGDVRYRNAARSYVEDLRANSSLFTARLIERKTVGDYSQPFAAPPVYHNNNALSFAIYAAEMGASDRYPDNSAYQVIQAFARYYWPMIATPGDAGWWGPRTVAHALNYILAVIALGHGDDPMQTEIGVVSSYREAARIALDTLLAAQGNYGAPPGAIAEYGINYNPPTIARGASYNFMAGLLGESLVLYDRIIGDPRIVPALVRLYDFLETQYHPNPVASTDGGGTFSKAYNYTDRWVDGHAPGPPSPAPRLNGLFMAFIGYLSQKTGDPRYAQRVRDLWDGVHADLARGPLTLKEFGENYRASSEAWGYLSNAP